MVEFRAEKTSPIGCPACSFVASDPLGRIWLTRCRKVLPRTARLSKQFVTCVPWGVHLYEALRCQRGIRFRRGERQ